MSLMAPPAYLTVTRNGPTYSTPVMGCVEESYYQDSNDCTLI